MQSNIMKRCFYKRWLRYCSVKSHIYLMLCLAVGNLYIFFPSRSSHQPSIKLFKRTKLHLFYNEGLIRKLASKNLMVGYDVPMVGPTLGPPVYWASGRTTRLWQMIRTSARTVENNLHKGKNHLPANRLGSDHRVYINNKALPPDIGIVRSSTTLKPTFISIPKMYDVMLPMQPIHELDYGDTVTKQQFKLLDMLPQIKIPQISCEDLFNNKYQDEKRLEKIENIMLNDLKPDVQYQEETQNCPNFIKQRGYFTQPMSEEEASFPIAYSILAFKDVEQYERLLRAIYRPQNVYCTHVDLKSNIDMLNSIKGIAKCFDNVHILSTQIDVKWGEFSVLEPDLLCMKFLDGLRKSWKYFINLTGQEWPLKTNIEIVQILKILNGAVSMEATIKRRNEERLHYKFLPKSFSLGDPLDELRYNFTLAKGSVHIAAPRSYVHYVLKDKRAKVLMEWLKDTFVADETFFTSLGHSPQLNVPGAFTGIPETDPYRYPFITRFKNWGTYPFDYPCYGQRVRQICIFSTGDLPLLASRYELFANKFLIDYSPLALSCMEQRHYNRTKHVILGRSLINFDFYRSLPMVKKHYPAPDFN